MPRPGQVGWRQTGIALGPRPSWDPWALSPQGGQHHIGDMTRGLANVRNVMGCSYILLLLAWLQEIGEEVSILCGEDLAYYMRQCPMSVTC